MRIRALGVGGFDNGGMPYNAWLVDGRILLEAPPDLVPSLAREGVDPGDIDTVFLSHSHGDHVFGMPFFLFGRWKRSAGGPGPRIAGPADLRERVLALAALAISPEHPYLDWIRGSCEFVTVREGETLRVGDYEAEFFPTFHEKETLGIGLRRGGRLLFQYLPDTRWDEGLLGILGRGAELVLCDVNGTGGFRSVHMGLEDLLPALARLGPGERPARVVGTHLSRGIDAEAAAAAGPDGRPAIEVARPGMVIEIPDSPG